MQRYLLAPLYRLSIRLNFGHLCNVEVSRFGLIGMFSLLMISATAGAQTRFSWPASSVDPDHYSHPSECLALTQRMTDSAKRHAPVWRDTMPWNPLDNIELFPHAVQQLVRRCITKFGDGSKGGFDAVELTSLYLITGNDTEASRIVHRTLLALGSDSGEAKVQTVENLIGVYLDAQPVRFDMGDSLATTLFEYPEANVGNIQRLRILVRQFDAAIRANDTTRARRYANRAAEINKKMSVSELSDPQYAGVLKWRMKSVTDFLLDDGIETVLTRDTKAYIEWMDSRYLKTIGIRLTDMLGGLGDPVEPLVADFWFDRSNPSSHEDASYIPCASERVTDPHIQNNRESPAPRRPMLGRPALIVFVSVDYCQRRSCWGAFASLRRLASEFPELEITLVSRTRGTFLRMEPPPPREEARKMCEYFVGYHKIPASLAITETQFFRVPGLDRRRIDEPTENEQNYTFDTKRGMGNAISYYLIDADGMLVNSAFEISRNDERRIGAMLRALRTRGKP